VYGERASSDRLVSGLRYAQQQALSRNRFVRVQIGQPSPARFRFHYCSADVPDPASCPDWHVLSPPTTEQGFWELAGGLQFAPSPPTIYFDALGRSVDGSGSVDGPTPIPLEGGDVTITVEGETGFAHGA
ncbi:GspH/FimT family pseudopilin, partial [Thiohalorhabdus sp.]